MVHVLQNWQQKGMYQCMFVLPYCRLGYVYGVASPSALFALASQRGWVTARRLTAVRTLVSGSITDGL